MNKRFQTQLIQARRNQIMEAAIEVIAAQGFQRTTIKQIANKAGVADGTIYNYFKNKDDILLGILARFSEAEVREAHFAEAEQLDFETFVTDYIAHRMAEVEADYQIFKVILPEIITDRELGQAAYEQIYTPLFTIAEDYFRHLMAQGRIDSADPALTTRLFASPLLGLLLLRLLGDEHIAANWNSYTKAMSQFLLGAYQKNEDNNVNETPA